MPRNRLMWQPNNDSEQKFFSPLYQNGNNTNLNRGQYCPYEENRDVFLHVVCHRQTQSWATKGVCSFFQDSWIKEAKCSFKIFPQAQTSVLNLNLISVTFSNYWGTGTAACSGVDRNSLNYSRYAVNEQSIMFLCKAGWAACNNQACCSSNLSLQFDILDKCQKTL